MVKNRLYIPAKQWLDKPPCVSSILTAPTNKDPIWILFFVSCFMLRDVKIHQTNKNNMTTLSVCERTEYFSISDVEVLANLLLGKTGSTKVKLRLLTGPVDDMFGYASSTIIRDDKPAIEQMADEIIQWCEEHKPKQIDYGLFTFNKPPWPIMRRCVTVIFEPKE